ncbi:MAG TPA: chorismate mutase family protein [Aurantimonas sp.]|uniref:chorismate mutase n=1 Tax=Aurantimonas marianensis TaxID=2920428 RepID=A0A9X2H3B9_9HYPH|nr:chorismate mutase family protein [Aurantimonas marianensis]MCP3054502.1 chorismate mutase family protein [Aurantimonas marianensis]
MRRQPTDCDSMEELRAEIDRLDGEIFDLFAERMRYIRRAADIKREANIPADVPERVDEVIFNARTHAAERGLDPNLYGRFWERLVRAAIAVEKSLLTR